MVFRQKDTGLFDGVDAHGLLNLVVIEDVAESLFFVGTDLEQDDVADGGKVDQRVTEVLISIVDGLRIDAGARFGVVFDLDGQIAADGLDEDPILDGDMGMASLLNHVTGGTLPLKFVLRWETKLMVAAIIEVFESVPLYEPLEGLDVLDLAAHAEDHEEVGALEGKLGEAGLTVEAVEVLEVLRELLIGQQLQGFGAEVAILESVQGEDILRTGLGTEAHEDVIPEEKVFTDGHHVPGDAVVCGGDTVAGEQLRLHRAEGRLTSLIESVQPFA